MRDGKEGGEEGRDGDGKGWGKKKRKEHTDILNGIIRRHMFRHALEHLNLLIPRYQLSPQIGEIRDEDARVEVALEEVVACVFEPGFGEVLEADALVDVVELFCLYTLGGQFVVSEGGREGEERKKKQTSSSSTVSFAWSFFRCSSATWTSSSTLWLSRRDSAWAMSVVGRSDWTAFTARTSTRDFGNVVFRAISANDTTNNYTSLP